MQRYTSGGWAYWYKVYSNNWIEQGGYYAGALINSNDGSTAVSLAKPMADTQYSAVVGVGCGNVGGMNGKFFITAKSTSSLTFASSSIAGNFRVSQVNFQIAGWGAGGEQSVSAAQYIIKY